MSMRRYTQECAKYSGFKCAYFYTEYAIHKSLPIYSGGLGVLSGYHLKSLQMMWACLLLEQVYITTDMVILNNFLALDGFQQEEYIENNLFHMLLEMVRNEDGIEIVLEIDITVEKIYAKAWKVQVREGAYLFTRYLFR